MTDYSQASIEVRQAIARNDETAGDDLRLLAQDSDRTVREAVARHPNTPTEILLKLGEEFPDEITANPIFNILLLENPESQFVRLSLARSSTTSEEAIARLADMPNEEILCAVARNLKTPLWILEYLTENPPQFYDWDDPDGSEFDRLFACIAKNPKTTESMLLKLSEHGSSVKCAIAQNPNAPIALLEQVSDWQNVEMWNAIVKNPNTPVAILEKLAACDSPQVRKAVTMHPNVSKDVWAIVDFMDEKPGTPTSILEKLASDPRLPVRHLVAKHPKTSASVLEKLVDDLDFYVQYSIVTHPNITSSILERFIRNLVEGKTPMPRNHGISDIFGAIVRCPEVTPHVLASLVALVSKGIDGGRINIYAEIVQHERSTPETITALAQALRERRNAGFYKALSNNSNTPPEALGISIASLINYNLPNIPRFHLLELISHSNVPASLLEELATHSKGDIRKAVAQNSSASLQVLRLLAEDKQAWCGVAKNKNAPVDLLLRFVVSRDRLVRMSLASNTGAPLAVLEALADDHDESVRAVLAANPSTPLGILERLAAKEPHKVAEGLLKNLQTTAEILENLAKLPDSKIRQGIAQHPNASPEILLELADEEEMAVVSALIDRDDLSESILAKIAETIFRKYSMEKLRNSGGGLYVKLAENSKTPVSILEMLASNQPADLFQCFTEILFRLIRLAVANNPSTPRFILEKLSADHQRPVRSAARKRLQAISK